MAPNIVARDTKMSEETEPGNDMNTDCTPTQSADAESIADAPGLSDDSRRKFVRKSHRDKCQLFIETANGREQLTAWMLDVSATGVRFRMLGKQLPKRGVIIQLPGMTDKATTVKIVRANDLGGDHWEYGARFTGIVELDAESVGD